MYTRQPLNPRSWRNEVLRAKVPWDPVNYPSHRSLRATTTRISLTWLSHGYGLYTDCCFMLILPCSLCVLCLLLCLCHAIVTLACIYPWFTIMLLLCVFACLVEILVAIAMFIMCLMLLMLFCSYHPFMLVLCHVNYSCTLFAPMTCLPWLPLVRCIFALLACLPWFIWFLSLPHHPCSILTCFLGLMHICSCLSHDLSWSLSLVSISGISHIPLYWVISCYAYWSWRLGHLTCDACLFDWAYCILLFSHHMPPYHEMLPCPFLWWAWCIHLLGTLPHEWLVLHFH